MSLQKTNENKRVAFQTPERSSREQAHHLEPFPDKHKAFDDFFENRGGRKKQVMERTGERQAAPLGSGSMGGIGAFDAFEGMQKEMRALTSGIFGKDGMQMASPFGMIDSMKDFGDLAGGSLPSDLVSRNHNPDGYSFCHSSVTKFDEKGQKYQKTHTLNRGPDGLKEEKKTLDDRDEQLKQMSLGQYIHERGVETEKTKRGSNPIETKRTLHHLQDEQVGGFEKEWKDKVGASSGLLNIGFGRKDMAKQNHRRLKSKQ